jgi:hypothetical protein
MTRPTNSTPPRHQAAPRPPLMVPTPVHTKPHEPTCLCHVPGRVVAPGQIRCPNCQPVSERSARPPVELTELLVSHGIEVGR